MSRGLSLVPCQLTGKPSEALRRKMSWGGAALMTSVVFGAKGVPLNITCDVLSSKLPALGGRLPPVDDCILRNGWLLAIDDEPVGKRSHLYRALCKLPLQLLDERSGACAMIALHKGSQV